MNINKALQHFGWKFKNHWKPTKTDIEAYNAIIDFKEQQQSINLSKNESLAKLWIHQLMLLNQTEMYSASRAIQVIDEILSKSVYEWCLKLKDQSDVMRFNTLLDNETYKQALKDLNVTKMRENGVKSINNNEQEFKKALTQETKEEHIIKFVEIEINRIINKYEKL